MRTVQITLDEHLADEVDRAVEQLGTSRSGFTRQALRNALLAMERERLEQLHRLGYEKHPAGSGEFDGWEEEQVWAE